MLKSSNTIFVFLHVESNILLDVCTKWVDNISRLAYNLKKIKIDMQKLFEGDW